MSDFKAIMHQIRFRLGLRPRPRWGSSQRSPRLLAGFKGPTSKGKGRGGEREGEGREGEKEGEREEGRLVFYTFIRPWTDDVFVGSCSMLLRHTLKTTQVDNAGRPTLPVRRSCASV